MAEKKSAPESVSLATLQESIRRHVRYSLGKEWQQLSGYDLFTAVALAVREILVDRDVRDRSPLSAGECQTIVLSLH